MNDPYIFQKNCEERLWKDFKTHGKIVIAYDFDNTVHDCHGTGETYPRLLNIINEAKAAGHTLICYTANDDTEFVKKYLDDKFIPYHFINESPIQNVGAKTSSKLYFNILLDDRAGLPSAYKLLKSFLAREQYEKAVKNLARLREMPKEELQEIMNINRYFDGDRCPTIEDAIEQQKVLIEKYSEVPLEDRPDECGSLAQARRIYMHYNSFDEDDGEAGLKIDIRRLKLDIGRVIHKYEADFERLTRERDEARKRMKELQDDK